MRNLLFQGLLHRVGDDLDLAQHLPQIETQEDFDETLFSKTTSAGAQSLGRPAIPD